MMPGYAYLAARRAANHHLQVEVIEREPLTKPHWHYARTRVRAVRVFKSDSGLPLGKEFWLNLTVYPTDSSPMPGAGGEISEEQYLRANFYEVYLNDRGPSKRDELPSPDYYIAASEAEIHIIDQPTEVPVIPCPTKKEADAAEREFNNSGISDNRNRGGNFGKGAAFFIITLVVMIILTLIRNVDTDSNLLAQAIGARTFTCLVPALLMGMYANLRKRNWGWAAYGFRYYAMFLFLLLLQIFGRGTSH